MKGRVATRKVYAMERRLWRYCYGTGLCARRSIRELRRIARRIWARLGTGMPPPAVVAGIGTTYSTYAYPPYHRIELVRCQRNVATLLHELAHALVAWRKPEMQHGPRFRAALVDLLLAFGPAPERTMAAVLVELL